MFFALVSTVPSTQVVESPMFHGIVTVWADHRNVKVLRHSDIPKGLRIERHRRLFDGQTHCWVARGQDQRLVQIQAIDDRDRIAIHQLLGTDA